jgi:hypothetical protein
LIGTHANTLDGSVECRGVEPVICEFVLIVCHFDSRGGFDEFTGSNMMAKKKKMMMTDGHFLQDE